SPHHRRLRSGKTGARSAASCRRPGRRTRRVGASGMTVFDIFIALDGNGLNGFEGFGGVARLRCDPKNHRYEPRVKFFDGTAVGHATQINPQGTIGFLGNLSQSLLFYDPRTLEELRRFSTLRFGAPDVHYASQTHVVWLEERSFVTAIGDSFFRFE